MILTSQFTAWLRQQCPTLKFHEGYGSPLPDKPDRLVIVTRSPGPGETMDGLFDRPAFICRTRGSIRDPGSAEMDAMTLDNGIRRASIPMLLGDSWVTSAIRLGGLGPIAGTPDNGLRYEWIGTYILTASTNL